MSVVNPGVGALIIQLNTVRLFVDAFNSLTDAAELNRGDILLFTHDDSDHFDVNMMPCIKNQEITVIGPPSIVKPLLESGKASLDQIQTVYSPNNHEPVFLDVAGIRLTCFRTPHFLDWKPIHNSYLVQYKQRSVYITGDSYLGAEMKDDIGDVDIVICNLVEEGYITDREDKRFAVHHLMSYLLNIMAGFSPEKIIGVHLIGFDGTISPKDMKKLAADYHFDEIIIPTGKDEMIGL
jgi:L-ascorbate metabolism protein UlaG (beta-lactamase superfamily)